MNARSAPRLERGILLRNMGPQATAGTLRECARLAEQAGLDHVWVVDHLAIPPDEAEGSGGRYLDPLTTLAWLAAATTRLGLGIAVLIAPYRPPLPTAKVIATLQELCAGRFELGVGVGWMDAEFRALGVDRRRRGELTDEFLAFLHECFANEVAASNGQRFIFAPRPARPPFLIGGAAAHAFPRIVRHGDGWMPMSTEPAVLAPQIAELTARMADAGRPAPRIVPLGALPLADSAQARERLDALAAAGVTGIVHAARYDGVSAFVTLVEQLGRL
ncbi:MAG: TIGR03619 family F420-dependent LLM class oxidoreductase [Gammaproteobacteria bacterium]|nr:TIGR03619 family F420-dependent LLM class oxidoreductase [Gammaproteobacteria bacterium]MBI5617404.1 TIGR03619 family F420-dependent LLM class oxidoreductase [Gammaproteobacteria bacterium]